MTAPYTDPTNVGNAPGDGPLRAGGQSVGEIPTKANLPSTPSKAVEQQQPALQIMRDTSHGTERIRACGTAYLPQAPGEDPQNYSARLNRSVFYNVTGRTIEGLAGQIFRKDPVLSDSVPLIIRGERDDDGNRVKDGHWENIDLAGTHGDVFLRDLEADAITAGHAAILVDFPATDGVQDAQAEQSGEIRPYWVPIMKDNIVSWRTAIRDGTTILTQIVLKETTMVADGLFGEKEQVRYRMLWRDDTRTPSVGFFLLEVTENKTVSIVGRGLYPTQVEIPVAEVPTSGRKSLFVSVPPLLDLAYLNIAHYQQLSDDIYSRHKTCVPVLFGAGFEQDGPVVIGPNTAVFASNPGAKLEYVSHSGEALAACKSALDDLKADMGTLGLQMLAPQKRSAETLGAKQLDKSTEDSALAVTARGLQDATEKALGFHARYLAGSPSGGSVEINKEFDKQRMEADMLTAWTGAVGAGVPKRYMLADMQQGDLISDSEDVDQIADEMDANAAAEAERTRQAEHDKITLMAQTKGAGKGVANAPA